MKSLFLTFFLLLVSISLFSQNCIQAIKVDTAGFTIKDAQRRNDGTFVVSGIFGQIKPIQLDTLLNTATDSVTNFIAIQDSIGHYTKAVIVSHHAAATDEFNIAKIGTSPDGSIYLVGSYAGNNVYLNNALLPATYRNKLIIIKYNSNLQFQWVRASKKSNDFCGASDVSVDLNNNVFVSGSFSAIAFEFADTIIYNRLYNNFFTKYDAIFMKLDSAGNLKYIKSLGSNSSEVVNTLTADSSGNIIITGTTSNAAGGSFDFDVNYTCLGSHLSTYSFFMAKYRGSDGHCIWGKLAESATSGEGFAAYKTCLAENNSIILSGTVQGRIFFPPYTYNSPTSKGFIAKIDSLGNNLWFEIVGGTYSSYGNKVTSIAYQNGIIAVCGKLLGSYPYIGSFPLWAEQTPVPNNNFEAFCAQFSSAGKLLWARSNRAAQSNLLENNAVLFDDAGNQLVWGNFMSSQTWYPITLSSNKSISFFVKYAAFSANPAFTVSAGPDVTITCGASAALTGSVTPNNIAFGWSSNMTAFAGYTSKNPTINPGYNSTYILYSAYQGCYKSDTVNVIYSNYNLTVNAGNDLNMCGNGSAQIFTTSNHVATYSWLPTVSLSSSTAQNPIANPSITTDYVVTATYAGCKAFDTVRVNSRGVPHINLPISGTGVGGAPFFKKCNGELFNLNFGDSSTQFTVFPTQNITYVNNNLATLVIHNYDYLIVTAVDTFGCRARDSVLIRGIPLLGAPPIMGTLNSRTDCPGDSIKISIYINSSLDYQYSDAFFGLRAWQVDSLDGKGWQDIMSYTPDYEIKSVTYSSISYYSSSLILLSPQPNPPVYKFRFWTSDYCGPRTYSNVTTVNVGPTLIQPYTSKELCLGNTDSISVNSNNANTQYSWEIKQGTSFVPILNQPGFIVANGRFLRFENIPLSLDSIIVRCKVTGCSISSTNYSKNILITVPDTLIQSQTLSHTQCAGTHDSLFVKVGNGTHTYQWFKDTVPIFLGTHPILHFYGLQASAGNSFFRCRITNPACGQVFYSQPIWINVLPQPTLSWPGNPLTLCATDPLYALSGATPLGGNYYGSGVSLNTLNPSTAGVGSHLISYAYYDTNGCANAIGKNFVIDLCTGVIENESGVFKVFKKNSSFYFTQDIFNEEYQFTVYNTLGKLIGSQKLKGICKECILPLTDIAGGIYFLQFKDAVKQKSFKIQIE
ncbi:MAG: hypothetical protein IPP32_13725 [Bacteroidetes bacterium]|nr:hypothetical protein [Bacteroidota bacterium]